MDLVTDMEDMEDMALVEEVMDLVEEVGIVSAMPSAVFVVSSFVAGTVRMFGDSKITWGNHPIEEDKWCSLFLFVLEATSTMEWNGTVRLISLEEFVKEHSFQGK
mmetsp:Transcript_15726/g.23946  ORF Transcript_15726/g.23946 Transcript_15726/m.23946 type:complete len:105 (+) Transcript_15726:211-525(+)